MNSVQTYISEKELDSLLSRLSPTKIDALEKTLKSYKPKFEDNEMISVTSNKENDEFDDLQVTVKSEPIAINKPFFNSHKTKNRGLTYENGRRNLKSESVSGEEKERRAKRRERNRVAAQRCRERRQQQIDELQHQVDMLRSTEDKLNSTLRQLAEEENILRIKLSKHNCIISENNSGNISFLIRQNFNNNNPQYCQPMCCISTENSASLPLYSVSRPNSLPMPNQIYHNQTNFSISSEHFYSKDDSLTPLFSPENYGVLKCQLQPENIPTISVQSLVPITKSCETDKKVAFSWNKSIVEHLSMSTSETITNSNDLSTPVVDMPIYTNEPYSLNKDQNQSINWHSLN